MSIIETLLWGTVIAAMVLVVLPIMMFLCVRFGTAGFYMAQRAFNRTKKESRDDKQAAKRKT